MTERDPIAPALAALIADERAVPPASDAVREEVRARILATLGLAASRDERARGPGFGALIGRDVKMRQMFAMIEDIAPTNATVVLEGEPGTGKELIAEELHKRSPRRAGPLIVFDCGSVPRQLVESALFGYVKGCFTGASIDRRGAIAEADGGTIVLDEIGYLEPDIQRMLVRVLDKRQVRKIGSNRYDRIDVRVIATTTQDLRAQIAAQAFREDLYYRLAVIRVGVPPLRERATDIPLLVDHFVSKFAPGLGVRPEDLARLVRHDWGGNVRELRGVIERGCLLARGSTINLDDAPGSPAPSRDPGDGSATALVAMFEREYLDDLLRRHKMDLGAAAREAQLDREHLLQLIRTYQLDRGYAVDGDEN